ncbi:MAG: hypothetical protein IJT49_03110 [Clostridia bacterium]|nr:hypothetical protein [Clostridia bacterium]
MKRVKMISLILAAVMLFCTVPAVQAQGDTTKQSSVFDEIPYTTDYVPDFSSYVGDPMNIYTEETGAAAGVPAGYTGYVMSLYNVGQTGITVDFSDKKIAQSDIQSVDFRIYYGTGVVQAGNGIRVKYDQTGATWSLYAPDHPGEWTVLSVTDSTVIANLCKDGYLGKFGLGFRFGNGSTGTCYVDYVSVTLLSGVKDEIPYTAAEDYVPDFSSYAGNPMNIYTEDTGAAAGVPAGYTGYVMSLYNAGQTGITVDFTDKKIAQVDIQSVDFRIYYGTGVVQAGNGIRVKYDQTGATWSLYAPDNPDKWTVLSVTDSTVIANLCKDGYLGKFGLGFRFGNGKTGTCYVDYVKVVVKTPIDYDDVKKEIPYVDNDVPDFSQYVSSALNDVYTEESGAAAGIPSGYTGYVIKLTNKDATGLAVDFTDQKIPLSVINAVNIRMYYPDVIKVHETEGGIRIKYNKPGTAWKLYNPEYPEQWTVFSITDRNVLANLCDENGDLSKFAVGFRFTDSAAHSCYIDYVSVDIKPNDGTPPVITYSGPTDIITTANKPFIINASAYDEYEERTIPIDYAWSGNALDTNGKLTEGSYTCTISATDYYGNRSDDIVLNVTVGPADTRAPVIEFDLTEIYSIAGCSPVINVSVTDDHDDVALQIIWSANALDARGRLTQGDHTLTLRSEDLTGNTAEKIVTVHAGAEFVTTKPVEYEK